MDKLSNAAEYNSEGNQWIFTTLVYDKGRLSNQCVINDVEIICYPIQSNQINLGKSKVSLLSYTMKTKF